MTPLRARAEVVAELIRAGLQVRLTSDAAVLRSLGPPAPAPATAPPDRRAVEVGRRVQAAARRLPWNVTCLHQAIAAQRMLRRRGLPQEVHISLRPAEDLAAHAWVTSGGSPVVGGDGGGDPRVATLSLPAGRGRR